MIFQILWGFVGIFGILGIAVLLSKDRRQIDWKSVAMGMALQIIFGFIILWTGPGRYAFEVATNALNALMDLSQEGSKMVFGANYKDHFFAFVVLPGIIFISSLMSILFYLGIMQKVVEGLARGMVKVMRISGAEALSTCADIFVGQTEAPLVVKPYIASMTRSEIMAMMTAGFSTVSGGVMIAYIGFGADAGHLLAASLMAGPASLVLAKIIVPETEEPQTMGEIKIKVVSEDTNLLDAACRGANDGLKLALNVGAMILAFVALTALLDRMLGFLPLVFGEPLTFERILGWGFSGFAYLIGVDWADCGKVGVLLGKKMFLNEFIAYMDLGKLKGVISERSFTLATYALCGFANFASIAIQIGGTGSLVPERRRDIAQLGLIAMIAGTLTTLLTAAVAGMLLPR